MIKLNKFDNGFEYLEIVNKSASAKIALQGAHLFSFKRDNELLWVSKESRFEDGIAIRGGVPICWPHFGLPKDSQLKQHGYARTSMWKIISTKDEEELSIVRLKLQDSKHKYFEYECDVTITFYIGSELQMHLQTKNMDDKTMKITQALHTYFAISNISNISIVGLKNKPYFDALDYKVKKQDTDISISSEVDRIYQEVDNDIVLQDNDKKTIIKNTNSSSVIVWNPWIEKSHHIKDMQDDAYKDFVCIESANASDDFVILQKDEIHTLITKII